MNASLNLNLAVSDSVLAAVISQGEQSLFRECQAGKRPLEKTIPERALMRTGFSLCLLQGLFDF